MKQSNARAERAQRRKEKFVSWDEWVKQRLGTHMQPAPSLSKDAHDARDSRSASRESGAKKR
jgi:hypothetical protein